MQSLSNAGYIINEVYSTTPSSGVVLVFVSINHETLPESIATDTTRNLMLGDGQDVTATAFQPSCMYTNSSYSNTQCMVTVH